MITIATIAQVTRRASSRTENASTLNQAELIQEDGMLDGLASNPARVLVCNRNGHSDGQMALEVTEQ